MASDPDFVDALAVFAGLVAEIFLYGVYAPLFFVCLWVMLSRKDAPNWKLIAPLVAMFILSTAHVAVVIYIFVEVVLVYRIHSPFAPEIGRAHPLPIKPPGSQEGFYLGRDQYLAGFAANGLYTVLNLIGDGIVIYRYHVICDSGFKVVVLPIMLLLASTSMGVSTASIAVGRNSFSPVVQKLSLTGYSLSLVLNVACTALIAHRIWTSTRLISPLVSSRRAVKCYAVLGIIVESAAVYTVSMAVLIGTYAGRVPNATQVVSLMNVQIACIVPTLMLVRAGLSQKTHGDWDTTHPQAATAQLLESPIDSSSRSTTKEGGGHGAGL
ncbi:hypothetical protein BOTBODRAFT_168092 [Botryobasidium botryosum FD-172 SS1]|uniref:Integral membrane protein n=1 Tax=Botryobasidium botryosum (strain FD-172 SS1) TaxID=930990 RepID=A0A067LTL5_BOTB1|nr:hypothetical protein BOTBODRAFT_168092 [Botryobasidium botryosum FD-172 SS1]